MALRPHSAYNGYRGTPNVQLVVGYPGTWPPPVAHQSRAYWPSPYLSSMTPPTGIFTLAKRNQHTWQSSSLEELTLMLSVKCFRYKNMSEVKLMKSHLLKV